MDAPYFSAFAALAGSLVGGVTSMATSWVAQRAQLKGQQRRHDITRREELYRAFIEEAAKLYADAFAHNEADVSKLVRLYALISSMRVVSSTQIVDSADYVVRTIIETYLGPNKSMRDALEILNNDALNPLRRFSEACREELRRYS